MTLSRRAVALSALVVVVALSGCGSKSESVAVPVIPPAQPLAADQRVENPAYTRWATAATGTVVTYDDVTDIAGTAQRGRQLCRLVSRDDMAAVVSTQTLGSADGGKAGETQELKHLRWMGKPTGKDADPSKPAGTYATGEETLTINGKEYRTQWYKVKGHVEAGETNTQTWYSTDVPGGLVKSVHTIPAVKKTVITELAEVKTP